MKILPNLILSKKELDSLGDFNISLHKNQNHAGCKSNILVSEKVSNDVKNFLQFCTMLELTQIIKSLTRITCSSTSLFGHILTSVPERIYQEGVINVALSDHQLIYCTRETSRIKTGGVHKKIKFCSLKNYAVDGYKNALREINLPNKFRRCQSVVFRNLMTVIDNVAHCKTK